MLISYEAWKKSNFSHIKGRRKEKLKVRTEINEIEYRKQNISVKPKASTLSQFVQEKREGTNCQYQELEMRHHYISYRQ